MHATPKHAKHARPVEDQGVEDQSAYELAVERAADLGDIRVGRVALRSLAELFTFNFLISLVMAALLGIQEKLAGWLLATKGTALTTANAASVLLSWQGVLLIVISIVTIAIYITLDLFAHIYFCQGLLEGETEGFFVRARRAITQAFFGMTRFMKLGGWPTLIYIVLLAPLVGVGFSVGLTRDLYVPHFIMSVIERTPLYLTLYLVVMVSMLIIGLLHVFTLHGVLLDGLTPSQARRQSTKLVRANKGLLARRMLKAIAFGALVVFILSLLMVAAYAYLSVLGASLPDGEYIEPNTLLDSETIDDTTAGLLTYRAGSYFLMLLTVLFGGVTTLLAGSCFLLYLNHLYNWVTHDPTTEPRYPRAKRMGLWTLLLRILGFVLLLGFLAAGLSLFHSPIHAAMQKETAVVAHRLGGEAAPENSLEGLQFAIDQGCYGAETDIQRTKDGHYIINHDDTFERLTGNPAAPQDLTLDEIKKMRVRDPLFPDKELPVPTFEELLDASKGRIKLFVEFKGATADTQMVDDAVRIVKEHGAEDSVVFISLNYECIEYGKKTYPEFEYGLLLFAGYGDLALLNCDIVLAEEEMTTTAFIVEAHDSNRQVGVWTVNSETDLKKAYEVLADYLITDQVELAKEVRTELDEREDLDVIFDMAWHLK